MKTIEEDKTKKNLYPRNCQTCGAVFSGGPRAWYCPECRAERKAAAKKAYNARKRVGNVREIGSVDICQKCGEKYIVTGSIQKYCANCAMEAAQELDRLQGMEYYNKNKDHLNPKRNNARRKEKFCAVCGCKISPIGGRVFCKKCKKVGGKKDTRKNMFPGISRSAASRMLFMCP